MIRKRQYVLSSDLVNVRSHSNLLRVHEICEIYLQGRPQVQGPVRTPDVVPFDEAYQQVFEKLQVIPDESQ